MYPTAPSTPSSSYPERSFSITIFCSPAEMLLLPEPGVEARSLLPVSGPLPGVLSAVWTSLRIRGSGPNLDTMLCKDKTRGRCNLLGPYGEAQHAAATVVQNPRARRPSSPTRQIQQVRGGAGGSRAQESAKYIFISSPNPSGTEVQGPRKQRWPGPSL